MGSTSGAMREVGPGAEAHQDREVRADRGTLRFLPSRRGVQVALGLTWLLDGALQCQPSMFTRSFALGTLAGAGQGQPGWVAHSVADMARFLAPHMAAWNVLFALTQLAIGAAFLFNRVTKIATVASLGWAVAVWWLGEAFGGVLGGTVTAVTGAPGAVLLYALVALLLWPKTAGGGAPGDKTAPPSVAGASILGEWGGRAMWVVLWVGSAVLQLLPANRAPDALRDAIRAGASGEPRFLVALADAVVRGLHGHGSVAATVLAVVEVAVGLGVLSRHPNRALAAGAAVSVAFWVVGQDLGGILTGSGTDPNAGPLFVLLAAACWQVHRRDASVATPVHQGMQRALPGWAGGLAGRHPTGAPAGVSPGASS